MSLRHYEMAEQRLKKMAVEDFEFPLDEIENAKTDIWYQVDGWVGRRAPKTEHRYAERRLMVHILRRLMEIRLRQVEVRLAQNDRKHRSEHDPEAAETMALRQAQKLYLAAQMLPRYVTEEEHGRLGVEHSRLHAVMAGILAQSNDQWGVYRQINEAFAALEGLPESEEPITRVVIDLRQIYCRIARLKRLESLRKLRANLLKFKNDKHYPFPHILEAEALLSDIRQMLAGVEHRMTRDRKSLWWWMIMCRYKMVWLEYTAIIQKWRQGEVLKELEIQAQHLIDSVCRRVILDVFQLAYVAQSYLNFGRICLHLKDKEKDEQTWGSRFKKVSGCIKALRVKSEKIELVSGQKLKLAPDIEAFVVRIQNDLEEFGKLSGK